MTHRGAIGDRARAARHDRLLAGGALTLVLALAAGACGASPHPEGPGAAATSTAAPSGGGSTRTAPPGTPTSTPSTTASPATSTTAVPVTTAQPATTPATPALPVAPQSSAAQAAAALVSGWASGNRPVALSVAVPTAVDTLFAVPYPGANAVFRGCTTAFPPLVCTYGPPALGNGALFEIYLSQAPTGGWYVSSVVVET